jgi:hypothetical protein
VAAFRKNRHVSTAGAASPCGIHTQLAELVFFFFVLEHQNMHFYETKDGPHEQGRMMVSIELTGRTDADKLFKSVTAPQWLEFQKYHLEYKMHHLEQITLETGILAKTFRVMDLKGLGMSHFHRDLMAMIKEGNAEIEANYPEVRVCVCVCV